MFRLKGKATITNAPAASSSTSSSFGIVRENSSAGLASSNSGSGSGSSATSEPTVSTFVGGGSSDVHVSLDAIVPAPTPKNPNPNGFVVIGYDDTQFTASVRFKTSSSSGSSSFSYLSSTHVQAILFVGQGPLPERRPIGAGGGSFDPEAQNSAGQVHRKPIYRSTKMIFGPGNPVELAPGITNINFAMPIEKNVPPTIADPTVSNTNRDITYVLYIVFRALNQPPVVASKNMTLRRGQPYSEPRKVLLAGLMVDGMVDYQLLIPEITHIGDPTASVTVTLNSFSNPVTFKSLECSFVEVLTFEEQGKRPVSREHILSKVLRLADLNPLTGGKSEEVSYTLDVPTASCMPDCDYRAVAPNIHPLLKAYGGSAKVTHEVRIKVEYKQDRRVNVLLDGIMSTMDFVNVVHPGSGVVKQKKNKQAAAPSIAPSSATGNTVARRNSGTSAISAAQTVTSGDDAQSALFANYGGGGSSSGGSTMPPPSEQPLGKMERERLRMISEAQAYRQGQPASGLPPPPSFAPAYGAAPPLPPPAAGNSKASMAANPTTQADFSLFTQTSVDEISDLPSYTVMEGLDEPQQETPTATNVGGGAPVPAPYEEFTPRGASLATASPQQTGTPTATSPDGGFPPRGSSYVAAGFPPPVAATQDFNPPPPAPYEEFAPRGTSLGTVVSSPAPADSANISSPPPPAPYEEFAPRGVSLSNASSPPPAADTVTAVTSVASPPPAPYEEFTPRIVDFPPRGEPVAALAHLRTENTAAPPPSQSYDDVIAAYSAEQPAPPVIQNEPPKEPIAPPKPSPGLLSANQPGIGRAVTARRTVRKLPSNVSDVPPVPAMPLLPPTALPASTTAAPVENVQSQSQAVEEDEEPAELPHLMGLTKAATQSFEPEMEGDMAITIGDMIFVRTAWTDGFAYGVNLTSRTEGTFPQDCIFGEAPQPAATAFAPVVQEAPSPEPPAVVVEPPPRPMLRSDQRVALWPYTPRDSDELEVRPGDIITIIEPNEDNWAWGANESLGSKRGYFPLVVLGTEYGGPVPEPTPVVSPPPQTSSPVSTETFARGVISPPSPARTPTNNMQSLFPPQPPYQQNADEESPIFGQNIPSAPLTAPPRSGAPRAIVAQPPPAPAAKPASDWMAELGPGLTVDEMIEKLEDMLLDGKLDGEEFWKRKNELLDRHGI